MNFHHVTANGVAWVLAGVFLPLVLASTSREVPPGTLVSWSQPSSKVQHLVSALAQKGGIHVEVAPSLAELSVSLQGENIPLWDALDRIARQVQGRWAVSADGKSLHLLPLGNGQTITTSNGPFRIVVRSITTRLTPDTSESACDLRMLVHWEPRYPVYRIDTSPRISAAVDDRGQAWESEMQKSYQYPPAATAELHLRLLGIPRQARQIARLEGHFRVTLTDQLLTIRWDTPPRDKPVTQMVGPLSCTWKSLRRNTTLRLWEVELAWQYPPDHPQFDSYEESKWLRDVQVQWRTAEGRLIQPQGEEIYATGRKVQAICQFPQAFDPQAAGGVLLLTTPAPLREVHVPFRLDNIPLP
jgi:hypothetical protein